MEIMNDNLGVQANSGGRVVREIVISKLSINIFALTASLIFLVFFIASWKIFWNYPVNTYVIRQTYIYIILSFPVYVIIQALAFKFFGKVPWSKIKFGFEIKLLMPYANSTIPLKRAAYFWVGALPGLMIGVLPLILGLIIGTVPLSFIGLMNIMASTGNIFIIWSLRGVLPNQSVLEHADQCHFSIIEKS